MELKTKLVLLGLYGVVALCGGGAIGWKLWGNKPAVIKTVMGETRVEYRDRIIYRDRKTTKHTETTTTKQPDGSVITHQVEDSGSDTTTNTHDKVSNTETKTSSTTTTYQPRWMAGARVGLAGSRLHLDQLDLKGALVWGGEINYRLAGPVWVGGWGMSDRTFGLSLSLTF